MPKHKDCQHYWPITKQAKSGATTVLTRGHCLAKSLYAKNAPGKPVYPPKAKLEDLPNGTSKVVLVIGEEDTNGCLTFKEKK